MQTWDGAVADVVGLVEWVRDMVLSMYSVVCFACLSRQGGLKGGM